MLNQVKSIYDGLVFVYFFLLSLTKYLSIITINEHQIKDYYYSIICLELINALKFIIYSGIYSFIIYSKLQEEFFKVASSYHTDLFSVFSSFLGRVEVEAFKSTPKKCYSLFLVLTMRAGKLNFSTISFILLRLSDFFESPTSSWYCISISFLSKIRLSHDLSH